MKKVIIIFVVLLFGTKLAAQEVNLPSYLNHMMDNPFLISPSYAGIGTGFQLRLNGISQWVGVENAPNTQSASLEYRFIDRLGGGITIFNDTNGFTSQAGGKASLAYHLSIDDVNRKFLSFSFGSNYTQFNIETKDFKAKKKEFLPPVSEGTSNFDFSLLYRQKQFAISFNLKNLLDKEVTNVSNGEPLILRNFSVYTVYIKKIGANFELEPSIYAEIFESDLRSHTDFNVKLRRKIRDGYAWAGMSYTVINDQSFTSSTFAPLLGLKKHNLYVAYGFSLVFNDISNFNYGTHMISLGFDYNRRPSLARCTQDMGMF